MIIKPARCDLPGDIEPLEGDDGDGQRTNYYSWYRWVSEMVKPVTVFEIGVKVGWSGAAMFCKGATQNFIGFDNESYVDKSNTLAEKYLREIGYSRVDLYTKNTQDIKDIGEFLHSQPEIFHVDGSHSYEGCVHDLELVHQYAKSDNVIIVDDTSFMHPVSAAANYFLECHRGNYGYIIMSNEISFRGHYILVRR